MLLLNGLHAVTEFVIIVSYIPVIAFCTLFFS